MLRELSPNRLWIAEMTLRFYGIEVGTRMSICRLSDGSLLLHSPLKLNEELKGELDWLGAVRFVVSPNKLHHLFIGDYFTAYPEARIYAPPGLPEKRPELPFHGVPGDAPEPGWAEDLGQMVFRGYRYMEEVIFLHRQSHTLILADLLQSAHSDSPRLTHLGARLYETYGKPRVPPAIKFMFRVVRC
jgi:hypothetical protein